MSSPGGPLAGNIYVMTLKRVAYSSTMRALLTAAVATAQMFFETF